MKNLFKVHKTNQVQRQQYKLNITPKSNQVSLVPKECEYEVLRSGMPYFSILNPKKILGR